MKILCIGDLNADLLLPYGAAKRKIENKNIDTSNPCKVTFQGGGSVANTARVLGKLGMNPYFVTDLCKDNIGEFLKQEMKNMHVDMSYSKVNDNGTMVCVAVVEEDGSRVIFPWMPPHADVPHFKKSSFEHIPLDDYLIFTSGMVLNNDNETMQSIYDFIANVKEKTNSIFMFDLNMRIETYGYSKEREYFYNVYTKLADILVGSGEDEFLPLTSKENMFEAIHAFSKDKIIIARDGAKPIHLIHEDKEEIIECEKVKPLHTIGAGDTFNGVFIASYLKDYSLVDCVKRASYAASFMISHSGYLALPEDI